MSFAVRVDVTNPGQVLACCGLFELATRLDRDAVAHFAAQEFVVTSSGDLPAVLTAVTSAGLTPSDPEDPTASPLAVGAPFSLRLDWWKDTLTGGRELKVWAGSMQSTRIAQAMLAALRDPVLHAPDLFDRGQIVFDPADPTKKVEPFYFDARRAANAHARDIGFSPNDLDLTTTAFPAVEVLCLIGLQRFRPRPTGELRVFELWTWPRPLPARLAPVVLAGAVPMAGAQRYRFEVWFRSGQRKHKAFRAAVLVREGV